MRSSSADPTPEWPILPTCTRRAPRAWRLSRVLSRRSSAPGQLVGWSSAKHSTALPPATRIRWSPSSPRRTPPPRSPSALMGNRTRRSSSGKASGSGRISSLARGGHTQYRERRRIHQRHPSSATTRTTGSASPATSIPSVTPDSTPAPPGAGPASRRTCRSGTRRTPTSQRRAAPWPAPRRRARRGPGRRDRA